MTKNKAKELGLCDQCGFKGQKKHDPPCCYGRVEDWRGRGKGNCYYTDQELKKGDRVVFYE